MQVEIHHGFSTAVIDGVLKLAGTIAAHRRRFSALLFLPDRQSQPRRKSPCRAANPLPPSPVARRRPLPDRFPVKLQASSISYAAPLQFRQAHSPAPSISVISMLATCASLNSTSRPRAAFSVVFEEPRPLPVLPRCRQARRRQSCSLLSPACLCCSITTVDIWPVPSLASSPIHEPVLAPMPATNLTASPPGVAISLSPVKKKMNE